MMIWPQKRSTGKDGTDLAIAAFRLMSTGIFLPQQKKQKQSAVNRLRQEGERLYSGYERSKYTIILYVDARNGINRSFSNAKAQ